MKFGGKSGKITAWSRFPVIPKQYTEMCFSRISLLRTPAAIIHISGVTRSHQIFGICGFNAILSIRPRAIVFAVNFSTAADRVIPSTYCFRWASRDNLTIWKWIEDIIIIAT